jgi:hypothetical protein
MGYLECATYLAQLTLAPRNGEDPGITEGLHNKMEMISRRAFGFRNFKNYRLRVIALCGWNGVFGVRNISGAIDTRPT